MAGNVIVVASGETERRALPHLLAHLRARGMTVSEVRIPPRSRALDVEMAEKLMKSAWYENPSARPDKFVLLVDVDRADPHEVLGPMQERLPDRLSEIEADVKYAYAQEHLEAWYFADAGNLRSYLGGEALGRIDTSRPDEIRDPKRHLKNLLGDRVYTAGVCEEIARSLDARLIAQRSPSFKGFVDAVMNGSRISRPA